MNINRIKTSALLLAVVLVFARLAGAATITWTGEGGDGAWATATNWSTGVVPPNNSGDTIIVTNAVVSASAAISNKGVFRLGDASLTNSSTIYVYNAELRNADLSASQFTFDGANKTFLAVDSTLTAPTKVLYGNTGTSTMQGVKTVATNLTWTSGPWELCRSAGTHEFVNSTLAASSLKITYTTPAAATFIFRGTDVAFSGLASVDNGANGEGVFQILEGSSFTALGGFAVRKGALLADNSSVTSSFLTVASGYNAQAVLTNGANVVVTGTGSQLGQFRDVNNVPVSFGELDVFDATLSITNGLKLGDSYGSSPASKCGAGFLRIHDGADVSIGTMTLGPDGQLNGTSVVHQVGGTLRCAANKAVTFQSSFAEVTFEGGSVVSAPDHRWIAAATVRTAAVIRVKGPAADVQLGYLSDLGTLPSRRLTLEFMLTQAPGSVSPITLLNSAADKARRTGILQVAVAGGAVVTATNAFPVLRGAALDAGHDYAIKPPSLWTESLTETPDADGRYASVVALDAAAYAGRGRHFSFATPVAQGWMDFAPISPSGLVEGLAMSFDLVPCGSKTLADIAADFTAAGYIEVETDETAAEGWTVRAVIPKSAVESGSNHLIWDFTTKQYGVDTPYALVGDVHLTNWPAANATVIMIY